jgi:hypothetical protein
MSSLYLPAPCSNRLSIYVFLQRSLYLGWHRCSLCPGVVLNDIKTDRSAHSVLRPMLSNYNYDYYYMWL